MAAVVSTTVIATVVLALAMCVVVVVAVDVRVIAEISGDESIDSGICITADTTEKANADLCKCHLCTATDAAADQSIDTKLHKESCQRTMTTSVGIDDVCANDLAVGYIVDLKLLGMPEVLENLAVFIGYCNSHSYFSFLITLEMRGTACVDCDGSIVSVAFTCSMAYA